MPKSKGKGGKNRRRCKNSTVDNKRQLVTKQGTQEYAQVLKMLGGERLEAKCFGDREKVRICHIRGKMRKRVWIATGDIVLVEIREYEKNDNKADVVHVYSADDVRQLKKMGGLPKSLDYKYEKTEDQELPFEFGGTQSDSDSDLESDTSSVTQEENKEELNDSQEEREEVDIDNL